MFLFEREEAYAGHLEHWQAFQMGFRAHFSDFGARQRGESPSRVSSYAPFASWICRLSADR